MLMDAPPLESAALPARRRRRRAPQARLERHLAPRRLARRSLRGRRRPSRQSRPLGARTCSTRTSRAASPCSKTSATISSPTSSARGGDEIALYTAAGDMLAAVHRAPAALVAALSRRRVADPHLRSPRPVGERRPVRRMDAAARPRHAHQRADPPALGARAREPDRQGGGLSRAR